MTTTASRPAAPMVLDAAALRRALAGSVAVDALERALHDGFDPATTPARSVVEVPGGQLLLMPAAVPGFAGVKVAGVAPGNPAADSPGSRARTCCWTARPWPSWRFWTARP